MSFCSQQDQICSFTSSISLNRLKYKRANINSFNDLRKKYIWTTVNSMAEAMNGKNKSELVLLSQLSVLFKE